MGEKEENNQIPDLWSAVRSFNTSDERETKNYVLHNKLVEEQKEITKTETNYGDQRANGFLKHMDEIIQQEYGKKEKNRRFLIKFFCVYFSVTTLLVFYVIIDPLGYKYSQTIKLALVGAFFSNLVGLLIIVFKYVFSPTKEYYDFVMKIFKWNFKKHNTLGNDDEEKE